jgi:NAD(P)-dependent dehydrogenase (short-subunit alcohol dehydrogenase family)
MAIAFAEAGHRVAVTGRDERKLQEIRDDIPDCLAIEADVADPAQTESIMQQVAKHLGPIEVLINNAGIGGDPGDGPQNFVDMDPSTWWRVQETNLRGPMLYTRAVLPGMIERGHGVIINIGSYIAIRPTPMSTAYGSSKAALARFSDCLATEVADQGVQVFCASPGLVLTDMTRDLPFIRDIPEQEFHQPEDIAALACELASGKYADLSGLFLHVRDDLPSLLADAERVNKERLYQLRLSGLHGLIE